MLNDYGEPGTVTTLQTSNYGKDDVSLEIARTFIRDEIGCVKELSENEISYCNSKENFKLIKMLSQVPTEKSRDFYGKVGGFENVNLALQDLEGANPKIKRYDQEGGKSSRRSEKSLNRKASMPRRMISARSNRSIFKHSETNKSRIYGRKSSLRSKKSIITPTSRRSKRHTVHKRKKTVRGI